MGMSRHLFAIAITLPLCLAAGSAWAMGDGLETHADCAMCHLTSPATAQNLSRGKADLCDGCHDARAGTEHRVGMPIADYKGTLPLPGGTMACVSCHQWHIESRATVLWAPSDALCMDCHSR